jgi:hypothetical protein
LAEFDIGVLMGSRSDTIFDEYVALHPGARRLKKMWEGRCKCHEPDCFREGLQEIGWMCMDDAELVLAFLDRFSGPFEPMEFEEFDKSLIQLYDAVKAKHGKMRVRYDDGAEYEVPGGLEYRSGADQGPRT